MVWNKRSGDHQKFGTFQYGGRCYYLPSVRRTVPCHTVSGWLLCYQYVLKSCLSVGFQSLILVNFFLGPRVSTVLPSAYLSGQITMLAVHLVHHCVSFNTTTQQSIKAACLLVMLNTQGSVQGQVKEMFTVAESQARMDRALYCFWLHCHPTGMVHLAEKTFA